MSDTETANTCGICGGPNDAGEICAKCAEKHREITVAHAMEHPEEEDPYTEYGFDLPSER